jgi:predicted HTH transcriptional regulator
MSISKEDFNKEKFIYNESDKLEYKETFKESLIQKYIETICGFLNSGGGKLIFGISDDLCLVGLNFESKKFDKCILKIDEIIRNKYIIGINKETNSPINLAPICIKPTILTNINDKKFLIVDVIPEINIVYQLLNGKSYYRLGASNYFNRCEIFYTEAQYNDRCNNYKKDLQKENKQNITLFTEIIENKDELIKNKDKKINELQSLNNELITNIKHLTNDNKITNEIYNNYIQNTIKYIQLQQIPYYNYFKKCLSDCYPN